MMTYDIVLIHPPSLFDFRMHPSYGGPISEVIPSLYVFDMYPYGFLSLASHLEDKGFKVGIFNIASKMLSSKRFDPVRFLEKLDAKVYGVDLHWLVHSQGALKTAEIIKKSHPNSLTLLGGLTATYYWREILENYDYVDAVMLGDTTEQPLERFLEILDSNGNLNNCPNLAWRSDKGIVFNGIQHVPSEFKYRTDPSLLVRNALRNRDIFLTVPYYGFVEKPIVAVLTVKGCIYNCIGCGGSCYTYKKYYGRSSPAFKNPEMIREEVEVLADLIEAPIFIVGDPTIGGVNYASKVLEAIIDANVQNEVFFEVFKPVNESILKLMRKTSDRVYIQISPESPYEDVRFLYGRKYDNTALEKMISETIKLGFERLDLYFMTGLPEQTYEKALGVASYYEYLQNKLKCGRKVDVFLAPLAPFVDPGSIVYDNPEKYGYTIFWRRLEDYRVAIEQPYWGLMINYETRWMNRPTMVKATINASLQLARTKYRYNLISGRQYYAAVERLEYDLKISSEAFRGRFEGVQDWYRYVTKEYEATEDLYRARSLVECLKVPPHLKIALRLLLLYSKLHG